MLNYAYKGYLITKVYPSLLIHKVSTDWKCIIEEKLIIVVCVQLESYDTKAWIYQTRAVKEKDLHHFQILHQANCRQQTQTSKQKKKKKPFPACSVWTSWAKSAFKNAHDISGVFIVQGNKSRRKTKNKKVTILGFYYIKRRVKTKDIKIQLSNLFSCQIKAKKLAF